MGYYFQYWTTFLSGAEALVGVPLCAAGVVLVLAGWRIWPVAAFGCFAVVGAVVGQILSGHTEVHAPLMGAGALIFALASLVLRRHSATLLGGLVGGTLALLLLEWIGIVGPPQWIGAVLALGAALAWAYTNRQRVAVVITSFVGAVLLVSGLAVVLGDIPAVAWFFRSMVARSELVILFFLLVPTVIGMALQTADGAQKESRVVRV